MATIKINGCNYFYEIHGSGSETIVFSHGLLWSGKMFEKQVAHLKDRFRIVTYDHRGQGQSEVTESGYDMDTLYEDAAQLIEKLELRKVHFGGLSMGGFVGLRLAARRPDLIKSLVLMETTAMDEPNKLKYWFLNTIVKLINIKVVTNPVMKIMFSDKFLNNKDRKEEREKMKSELQKLPKTIVRAVEGVIQRNGVEDELEKIKCPTLIMVGTQDKATVPAKSEYMHSKIAGSILKYVEGGGHTASVEEPEQYNKHLDEFYKNVVEKASVYGS
jgi:3-oxoadipate enol-lactonase